ncbi:hypothetical protein NMG60_11009422 [Bertholletia excelsa]
MDECGAQPIDIDDLALGETCKSGVPYNSTDLGEMESAMEVLTRVDLELAYSSEKLVNLDKLLMHVMACENDLEAMTLYNDNSSIDLTENVLLFDFLSAFLDSEVGELNNFIGALNEGLINARENMSSCKHLTELFFVMEDKLNDSQELLKQSQVQVLELRKQSAKLQQSSLDFKQNNWKYEWETGVSENGKVESMDEKPKMQTVEQKRHILRMLEKSLGRELDLEKKLSESKQNQEDMIRKQRLTEQVAFCMEEAAQVVWGRFLEADNAAEVLMGISKELVGELQTAQFNINASKKREDETKWKLLECMEQLKDREIALEKLENSIAELITDNSEVCTLREKVELLEEQLKESDTQLKNVNCSNEAKEQQLREMENIIGSLRENIYVAESRAESAEVKINQLTETNMDLSEEISFLKNTNDSSTKKVSLLETQLRELESYLQHAKASSEASQEQQNMLYSAIWDMETLIEELKSKVSKAEMKTEDVEDRCVILSDANIELNKEVTFLRTKVEHLETSLEQVNEGKIASTEDVNIQSKLIMDMVMQLAMERKRIQKQLFSLAEANKSLVAKLQKSERTTPVPAGVHENGTTDKSFISPENGATTAACGEASEDAVMESSSRNFLVDELSKDAPISGTEISSVPPNGIADVFPKIEPERAVDQGYRNDRNLICVFVAIAVLLLSVLASYIINKKTHSF